MKKLLIIMLSLGLALGAAAQRGHGGGGHVYYHSAPRVIVGVGYSPFYSPFYNPFYSPFYYPYYGFGYPFYGYPSSYQHNSKLDLQIQDIQNDYKNRIQSARHDESLTHKDRRAKVRQLKHDREQEIIEAKRDYYNKSHTHLNNSQNQNSQNQGSQNQEQSANPNQNFRSYQNN